MNAVACQMVERDVRVVNRNEYKEAGQLKAVVDGILKVAIVCGRTLLKAASGVRVGRAVTTSAIAILEYGFGIHLGALVGWVVGRCLGVGATHNWPLKLVGNAEELFAWLGCWDAVPFYAAVLGMVVGGLWVRGIRAAERRVWMAEEEGVEEQARQLLAA